MTVKYRFSISFLLLSLALSGAAAAQGFGGGRPAVVRVAEARVTELAPTIELPGTVASRFDARLAAEVAGRLVDIADIGERIEKDQPVAVINDETFRLQQDEGEAEVARAKSRIAFLSREVERLRKLAAQNVAAKSLLDQTESDLQAAREDLRIAAARLGLSRVQLNVTRIRAPFSGVVSERFKMLGERVSVGDEVVRLVNQEAIEVVARAPLDSIGFVSVGDALTLFNDRARGDGSVRTLVPVGDPRTHMFEIRVDISAQNWRIGETVRLVVPTQAAQALLAVPSDALILRRDGTTVFRINAENKAERIAVEAGISSNGWVAVSGQLSEGDRIVVRGGERLQPGQEVNILDSAATNAAAGAMTEGG